MKVKELIKQLTELDAKLGYDSTGSADVYLESLCSERTHDDCNHIQIQRAYAYALNRLEAQEHKVVIRLETDTMLRCLHD